MLHNGPAQQTKSPLMYPLLLSCLFLAPFTALLFQTAEEGGGSSYAFAGVAAAMLASIVFAVGGRLRKPPAFACFLLLIPLLDLVRVLFSAGGVMHDLRAVAVYYLYFIVCWYSSLGSTGDLTSRAPRRICRAVLLTLCAMAVVEYGSGRFIDNNTNFERVATVFSHPNAMSSFLVAAMIYILLPVLDRPDVSRLRPSDWIALTAGLVAVVLTKSLTSVILLAVIAAYVMRGRLKARGASVPEMAAALVAALAIIIGVIVLLDARSAEFSQISSILGGGRASEATGGSLYWRILTWRMALSGLPETLLLGSGLGAYGEVTKVGNLAHNEFLKYLVECGLLGFAAYVLALGSLLVAPAMRGKVNLSALLFVVLSVASLTSNLSNYTGAMCLLVALIGASSRPVNGHQVPKRVESRMRSSAAGREAAQWQLG